MLSHIIDLIPSHLEIELLKIDAQGMDLEVVQSAGSSLQKIKKIIIEVQDPTEDGRNMLSKNTATRQEVIDWFDQNGYKMDLERSYLENPAILEWNLAFDRIS